MSDRLEALLVTAESEIRLRGYHAVSFRELADQLGIKSSSVHYYFRQKEDLGVALIERYQSRFFEAVTVEAEKAKSPEERIKAFTRVYRKALVDSDRMCLCGMLGAESCGLPEPVSSAVVAFFEKNINWLVETLPKELPIRNRRKKAKHIVATLQGAMMLASALDDTRVFDSAVQDLFTTQELR
ncbi:MAG: TetR/AcrR family transcriptional regulator [Hyphomicrobiaceae bacterium]